MRKAAIYRNGVLAGTLTEVSPRHFVFMYDELYFMGTHPDISLTLPKAQMEYRSEFLFPVFYNMLSEGVNKKLQCTQLRLDEEDNFGLLLATAQYDTIGAITVNPIPSE